MIIYILKEQMLAGINFCFLNTTLGHGNGSCIVAYNVHRQLLVWKFYRVEVKVDLGDMVFDVPNG